MNGLNLFSESVRIIAKVITYESTSGLKQLIALSILETGEDLIQGHIIAIDVHVRRLEAEDKVSVSGNMLVLFTLTRVEHVYVRESIAGNQVSVMANVGVNVL